MPYRVLLLISMAAIGGAAGVHLSAADQRGNQNAPARMRYEAMDVNRDGVITRQEWKGSARSFAVHDWNGDGQLSGEEVRIGAQRNTNWDQIDPADTDASRFIGWTPAGFRNLDHNQDGRIATSEWHYDLETFRRVDRNDDNVLSEAEFLGAGYDDDRGDNFDDLDVNNNGRVELNEWHASREAFNDFDTNRDGVLSRAEVVGGIEVADSTYDQFASLDFNRNGTIERNEWHWSLGSFDRRDLDRNNVLSRTEFDAASGKTTATGAASQNVRVISQQRWTDAALDVRAGDVLTFDASGTVQMSDSASDTATPAGSRTGRRAPDAPILNQPAGALIARIGSVGPIFIGDRRTVTAPATGRLYLGINDDHLDDNRGEFAVTITRQARTSR